MDGQPFLAAPGNLALSLNFDYFKPFKNKQYSVGVFYLSLLNLPRHQRLRRDNVIVLGIVPGGKESRNVHRLLSPAISELLDLWQGARLRTHSHPEGRTIRAALLLVIADLPAVHKLLGFYGYTANRGCSKCAHQFPSYHDGEKSNGQKLWRRDYGDFHRNTEFPLRDDATERANALRHRTASTVSDNAADAVARSTGTRWSPFHHLPYFSTVRFHAVDPLHCMWLGVTKHLLTVWKEDKILTSRHMEDMQRRMDSMQPPRDVGGIWRNIEANLSCTLHTCASFFSSFLLSFFAPLFFGSLRLWLLSIGLVDRPFLSVLCTSTSLTAVCCFCTHRSNRRGTCQLHFGFRLGTAAPLSATASLPDVGHLRARLSSHRHSHRNRRVRGHSARPLRFVQQAV